MKVIKNCKILKDHYEEFPLIQIRYEDEVFVDLPVCTIEFGQTLEKPVLYPVGKGIPMAVELTWLMAQLAKLKKFHIKIDDHGHIKEIDPKDADTVVRLPADTNLDEVMIVNGQIIRTTPAPMGEQDQVEGEKNNVAN